MGLNFDDVTGNNGPGSTERREPEVNGLQLDPIPEPQTSNQDSSLPLVDRPRLFDGEGGLALQQPHSLLFPASPHLEASQGMKFFPQDNVLE